MHILFTNRKYGLKLKLNVEEIPTLKQIKVIEEEIREEIAKCEYQFGEIDWFDFQVICSEALEKHVRIALNTQIAVLEF